jgi:hypothetical protein
MINYRRFLEAFYKFKRFYAHRKIFILSIVLFTLSATPAYACTLQANPSTVNPNESTQVTFTVTGAATSRNALLVSSQVTAGSVNSPCGYQCGFDINNNWFYWQEYSNFSSPQNFSVNLTTSQTANFNMRIMSEEYGSELDSCTASVTVESTPTPTPTPSPTPSIEIVASPSSTTATVGTPFNVDVEVLNEGQAFNAAKATVTVSSNLSVTGINHPSSNACNLSYTKSPTTSDSSFAGAILGGSSTGCTVYTMTLIPISSGIGTISFANASVKAYADHSEILTGVQDGSYTISAATPTPTPPGTTLVAVDDSVQGGGQNQWNYVGSWSHCVNGESPCYPSSLYNQSVSWNNASNATATLTFSGIQVSLYSLVDPVYGIGKVSIDNGEETDVNFYAATRAGDVKLWTSPLLAPGTHTLTVRLIGNYVTIDRADVLATNLFNLTITNTVFETYSDSIDLIGTKDEALDKIFVNDTDTNTTYPTTTSWLAHQTGLILGANEFAVYGKDTANNRQTDILNIIINRHTLADINGDGLVDLIDFSLFAVDWGKTDNLTSPLSDMNADNSVNLYDFSVLAKEVTQ